MAGRTLASLPWDARYYRRTKGLMSERPHPLLLELNWDGVRPNGYEGVNEPPCVSALSAKHARCLKSSGETIAQLIGKVPVTQLGCRSIVAFTAYDAKTSYSRCLTLQKFTEAIAERRFSGKSLNLS